MDTVSIIILILFGVCFAVIGYLLYDRSGGGVPGKNEDIEKNIDRIGIPEGYKGITDAMTRRIVISLFPSLKLLMPNVEERLQLNLSLLLKKKDEKKEIFLMDVVYYILGSRNPYDECSSIACFLQDLDTYPVKISPQVTLFGKKLFYRTELVNSVPGFCKRFYTGSSFATQDMVKPSIRLNPEIQKLLLDYYDTFPFIHRQYSDAQVPCLYIGKDGVCLETLQTSYKDNLTSMVQFVEQMWEIINNSDFICTKV